MIYILWQFVTGIIENERAVVEIKYFPSLARTNQSLEAAALEKKNFALKLYNNVLVMNKKHDYYHQVNLKFYCMSTF